MALVIVLDCSDLELEARFWGQALRYRTMSYAEPYMVLIPEDGGSGPELILQRVPEPKTGKNRMHVDVTTDDVDSEVARLLALGATRITTDALEQFGMRWVVRPIPSTTSSASARASVPVGDSGEAQPTARSTVIFSRQRRSSAIARR